MTTQQALISDPGREAGGRSTRTEVRNDPATVRVRMGPYTLVEAVEVEEKSNRRGPPRREVRVSADCWALPGGGTASVRELRRIAARNGWLLVLPSGTDYLRAMRRRPLHFVACQTTNWDRLGHS